MKIVKTLTMLGAVLAANASFAISAGPSGSYTVTCYSVDNLGYWTASTNSLAQANQAASLCEAGGLGVAFIDHAMQ